MQSQLSATIISSLAEFETAAPAWNQLWDQSTARQPLSRSEGVSLWMRHFGNEKPFGAVLIRTPDDQLIGGLAFLKGSKFGLTEFELPVNCWVNAADLLIDESADQAQVAALVVQTLRDAGASILNFDHIDLSSSQWTQFRDQLLVANASTEISRRQRVGVVDVGSDWAEYFACLSGNHRSAVKRSEKKISKSGVVELLRIVPETEQEIEHWMQIAMKIEHQSWKGEAGSSILASAGMADYFLAEAKFANQIGALEMWFLTLDQEPIAFEYCHTVKQVCLSYKIGYDQAHKAFGPGRLLRKMQLEYLFNSDVAERTVELDTMGVLCNAKAKWSTRQYEIGRLMAAVGGIESKLLLQVFQGGKALKQSLKGKPNEEADMKLGGKSFSIRGH